LLAVQQLPFWHVWLVPGKVQSASVLHWQLLPKQTPEQQSLLF
jgi:hypothetical protein